MALIILMVPGFRLKAEATGDRAEATGDRAEAPGNRAAATGNPGQTPTIVGEGDAEFTLFIRGTLVGTEQVHIGRAGTTWIISSTARYGPPLNVNVNRFELKYTADWQPLELHIDAAQVGGTQAFRTRALNTSFTLTSAINEIILNGVTQSKTDQVSARTVVLPNSFFASYEGLAARLSGTQAGAELPAYVAPQGEIRISVKSVTAEQLPGPSGPLQVRRYDLLVMNPGAAIEASVTIDSRSRLVRLEIPSGSLKLVRSDLATVATRAQPIRNATDTDVSIPAAGFNLAGTLTLPPGTGRLRHPAVVLVAGSGANERDMVVAGIPIFAQLAGALAAEGFAVLRYDRRGEAQSGGRSERATLQDYADDLAGAVKWLSKRQDIDPRRIAVAGHAEGGAVAMLAAAKGGKIASLVLIAAPGTRGSDLVLEQQRHVLEVMKTPDAERETKIELQKKIQAAVISEKGWEALPPAVRKQADTPWFRSLLLFDPAKVMPKIKQPILILQGDLDTHVLPANADALAELAQGRKGRQSDLKHLPGLNHLLVPATTGEASEYTSLATKTVSPEVAKAIADWLKK